MHAIQVLQKIVSPVTASLDRRNARTVLLAVAALLAGRRLTLMELARHFPGAERVRAPLKRLDRLIGNAAVQAERAHFYGAATRWLVRSRRPVLVVDWSQLKRDGRWHVLRAAVAAKGRTLTVYEEVHPESRKSSPRVEKAFLRRLQAVLPRGVKPILVTDAGFRVPWFRAVQAMGWHWIGRVRHRTYVWFLDPPQAAGAWVAGKSVHPQATPQARALGEAMLARSNPLRCRLTLVRRAQRGRIERTRRGERARSGHARKMEHRAREPWLLASSCSLAALSAAEIVCLYAQRMQIEQSFRDLKSHRYGCAFDDTLTRDPRRLEMLLMLHMLACLLAWLEGLAATTATLMAIDHPSSASRYSALRTGWERLRRRGAHMSLPIQTTAPPLRALLVAVAA